MLLTNFTFYLCYSLYFIFLFLSDLGEEVLDKNLIKVILLCLICFFAITNFFNFKNKIKNAKYFIPYLFIAGTLFLLTKDFFWIIAITICFLHKSISEAKLFSFSFFLLLFLVILVVLFFFLDLLPDVTSFRDDFSLSERHSFGFYHSNVLPIVIFYLFVYYVFSSFRTNFFIVLFFIFVQSFLFTYCNSRNAFFSFLLVTFIVIVFKTRLYNYLERNLEFSKLFFVFSVLVAFLSVILPFSHLYLNSNVCPIIDHFFSNRCSLGSIGMNAYGINFINQMSSEEYYSLPLFYNYAQRNGVVLDSAYIFLFVRYGVLAFLCYFFLFFLLYKFYKNYPLKLFVLSVVILANVIDNDLLSYGFLPFFVLSFQSVTKKKLFL